MTPAPWPGEPTACTCTQMIAATLEETLSCPMAWRYVPGTGWLHLLPARRYRARRARHARDAAAGRDDLQDGAS
jgi:hypothetical protein